MTAICIFYEGRSKPDAVMLKEKIKTLGRFCTVGVGNTLIDFGVFFFLTACHIPYLPAQICSYSAGIINSYVWNRNWTFQVKRKADGKEIVRFLMINIAASGITFLLLYLFQRGGCSLLVSKLAATIGGMMMNFIGNRIWVFGDSLKNIQDQE
ncbi:GtrA family protein [Bacillus mojavensis]|uniref:GtrA family protein n=1 Tax=Bacillus mojavensis TaxID=72360 RepID=UPI00256F5FA4|nr:GtrA family protein [Bacillus mojavensis]MEC1668350.1 GtrA family protein [Bacillus mojavensis]MEC1738191.1 GtrA family protein [Bacillus mojavensis]MEC1797363.1 GtrA family protein [Bacillus mojavensis]